MLPYWVGSVFPQSHHISGLGSLSQLIRLWSMPHYRFTLNEESYFADTELAGFNERNLFHVRKEDRTSGGQGLR
jgi:hypothetical protein